MEQGLAQTMGGMQQGMQDNPQALVQEVVQMLMQGVSPDEIVAQGVPMEIVRQAVEIVLAQEQQMATTQAPPATDAGLAMTMGGM